MLMAKRRWEKITAEMLSDSLAALGKGGPNLAVGEFRHEPDQQASGANLAEPNDRSGLSGGANPPRSTSSAENRARSSPSKPKT